MTCRNCGLAAALPSANIDESGLCSYCRRFKGPEDMERERASCRARFEALLDQVRASADGPYDILAAYSGGKDSSFTLHVLKNVFGLRVLALTFDQGFVSPYAQQNITRVTESLGVDHVTFKASFQLLRRIFRCSLSDDVHPPKALERASAICNTCMGLVKYVMLRTAIEKRIPLIGYGWSPGQAPMKSAILKNHGSLLRRAQDTFLTPLEDAVGPQVRAYFLEPWHFSEGERRGFPHNVNPLAFLRYDEAEIYATIRPLGWEHPPDTDANSTNCLLNGFANRVHLDTHGFHPYALEMCGLVREGIIGLEEAQRRLAEESSREVTEHVRRRLGLTE